MPSYLCPFCSHVMAVSESTHSVSASSFSRRVTGGWTSDTDYSLQIFFYKCPNCNQISSILKYCGQRLPQKTIPIYPLSTAKIYPDYIPKPIRDDYEEACSIVSLSPKASATLSRRCLQGMIRDFWSISGKPNLKQEIEAIRDKVHPDQWKVIEAVRELGNIGAHMEKDINLIVDIDPGEAEKLIKLIELLMHDWYIRRFEQQQLYSDILGINGSKQEKRASKE